MIKLDEEVFQLFIKLTEDEKKEVLLTLEVLIAEPEPSPGYDLMEEVCKNVHAGQTAYYETHTAEEMIRDYEKETGCIATNLVIHTFIFAHTCGLKIANKRKAISDTI